MTVWAWIGCALLVGWGGSAWWAYRHWQRLMADQARSLADLLDLRQRLALTQQALSASERVAAALRTDHERALASWNAEVGQLRATVDASMSQVTALSHATTLTELAIQARADWAQAFTRNFTPTYDAELVPAKGWQCVLLDANGAVESTRVIRDGNAPTRIGRGHGAVTDWYRLARIDGLSLIYEPEHDPMTTAVA